jgi:3',5'-cyclic AMP phosphodiesterase CpdA
VSVRLVHLSDIHFGFEDQDATEAALAMAHDLAPSLTVVTGDLTLGGRPTEFLAARAWLDRLPCPMLATPGNHDTPYWNLILRSLTPFDRWRRYIGTAESAVFEGPGLAVCALNTARGAQPRPNWALGAINLAAVDDVAARLAGAAGCLRVFACHHPLIDVEGAPVSGGVHRGDVAARALCEAGVDLILTGHLHNPFARPLPYGGGLSYIAGAGTLSRRTRGVPASFSVIEAAADTLSVTAHAWTGSQFEPFRTWAFPRRVAATG